MIRKDVMDGEIILGENVIKLLLVKSSSLQLFLAKNYKIYYRLFVLV